MGINGVGKNGDCKDLNKAVKIDISSWLLYKKMILSTFVHIQCSKVIKWTMTCLLKIGM